MPHRPKAIEMTDPAASPHKISTYVSSSCLTPWLSLGSLPISTNSTTFTPPGSGGDGSGGGTMPHRPTAIEMADPAAKPHRASIYAFSRHLGFVGFGQSPLS